MLGHRATLRHPQFIVGTAALMRWSICGLINPCPLIGYSRTDRAAAGPPSLGVPEVWVPECRRPSSFYDAHESVLAFDCGLVAMPGEVPRPKRRRIWISRPRGTRQGDLGIAIGHELLIERSHARIWCFSFLRLGILRLNLPRETQQGNHHKDP